ncbi:MAG: hypothetical protein JO362_06180, partial [Streptomycetaceae bacterium]|nr:hypothetical protein [Streptomycetaceae bacterium]
VTALLSTPSQDSDRPALSATTEHPVTRTVTEDSASADSTAPDNAAESGPHSAVSGGADQGGQPDTRAADTDRLVSALPVADRPVTGSPVIEQRPETMPPVTDRGSRTAGDRRADSDTERLLRIAREAVKAQDKLTRKVVAEAIRGQEISLSNDRLTTLMVRLRETAGQHNTDERGQHANNC